MEEMLQRAWEESKALYPEMLQTLETITHFERGSGFGDLTGLRQTADFLKARLEGAGCTTTIHEDETWGPTLVGRKKGSGKLRVLMFAHMDTVWPMGECERRSFEIRDNRACGPGTSDCSHGILCQLYALKLLERLGEDSYGELILLFNPDEEHSSPSSTKWIRSYAQDVDVAFCMEGADATDLYITSRGGSVYYEMNTKGVQAHAGVNPEVGRNAIMEIVHKLDALGRLEIPDSYFSTSFIRGGTGECIIPDKAYAMFRFRVDTQEAERAVEAAVKEICSRTYISGVTTQLERLPVGFPPLERKSEVDAICELINATSREMGYPLRESFCGGGADAVTAQRAGAPTIDGMTPVSYHCHSREEYLDLDTLAPRIAVVTAVLARMSKDDRYLKNRIG